MKTYLCIISFFIFFLQTENLKSQVAVNITGNPPDNSAMLDVSSNSKGILIPRMLENERNSISSPAHGLMLYQTDGEKGFYYYNGTSWLYIGNEGNNLWDRNSVNGHTFLSNSTDNVGIGTSTPAMKLDVRGFAAATNLISVIPLWQGSNYNMTNSSGQDLSNCESGIEPSLYEPNAKLQVKLVIRVTSASGNNNFQLRAHDNSNEAYPIVSADSWTWNGVQTGWIVESEWKNWNASVNAWELHLFGWTNGNANFNSAYLLVRPQQP